MILLNKFICVKLQFFQKFFFPLVIQLYFKNENKQTKKKRSQVDEVRTDFKGPEQLPRGNTADIICLFVWLMKVTKVMKLSIPFSLFHENV